MLLLLNASLSGKLLNVIRAVKRVTAGDYLSPFKYLSGAKVLSCITHGPMHFAPRFSIAFHVCLCRLAVGFVRAPTTSRDKWNE